MSRKKRKKATARKNGPVRPERLDDEMRAQHRALEKLKRMSTAELVALAVRAGILDENHELTAPYRSNEPSGCRPTD